MILVDWQIEDAVSNGEIGITPFDTNAINPNSYDVRLGESFVKFCSSDLPLNPYNKTTIEWGSCPCNTEEGIIILPGECLLAETAETFRIPRHIVANIEGKSSLARLFLAVHQTGGWIDAGFDGTITLELKNHFVRPILLTPGMPIGQIVFHRTSPCNRSYGERADSKYQGQRGATLSRYHRNKPGGN